MARSIEVWVDGTPRPQGSKTSLGNGRMKESSRYVSAWRGYVGLLVGREWWGDPSDHPFSVELVFEFGLPKRVRDGRQPGDPHLQTPDIDKLERAVLDALTGIVWADDCQVVAVHKTKRWCHRGHEGVRITPAEWGDRDELSDDDAAYLDADMVAVARVARALREWDERSEGYGTAVRQSVNALDTGQLHRFAATVEADNAAHTPTEGTTK